ncbi:MAG: DUF177 domain-containing protein [Bacteroidota bacterium]
MKDLRAYQIEIFGLSNKKHVFNFEFDSHLFGLFEKSLVKTGKGICLVELEKSDSMLSLLISVEGTIELECDRSLKLFDHPISVKKSLIYKYGDEEKELSEDVFVIPKSQQEINIGTFLYETISLEVPMRKIHPDHKDIETENGMFYTSQSSEEEDSVSNDPRWDILKKLK